MPPKRRLRSAGLPSAEASSSGKAVVIDLTALTETLLRPNATAAVDLGRRGKRHDQIAEHDLSYEAEMVDWRITDVNFTAYGVHVSDCLRHDGTMQAR